MPDKSCLGCAHRSDAPELDGLPVCSKLTMPLALTSSTSVEKQEMMFRIANACSEYTSGAARQPTVRLPGYNVGMNPEVSKTAAAEFSVATQPSNCRSCKYFVPADVVMSELGLHHGLCMARGDIMAPKHHLNNARSCTYGKEGAPATSTAGIILHGHYSGTATFDARPSAARAAAVASRAQSADYHSKVNPREWKTDREVTEDQMMAGIMAWRLVTDPTGHGPDQYAPIFNHEHPDFSQLDADGNLIDPHDTYGDLTPHLYQDYAGLLYTFVCLNMGGISPAGGLNQTLCYVGESGTGKTEFAGYVAYLLNLPLVRISIRPSLLGDDLFGSPELVTDEAGNTVSKWVDGVFTYAYVRACVLLLDEPNAANDDVWMMLRPALDKGRVLTIEKLNRRLERHWANFIVLAMNPAHSSSYRGTRELSLADKRRFRQIHVPMPDAATEERIITSHCKEIDFDPPMATVKEIVAIGNEFRKMYDRGDLPESWGVRENIAVAELTWFFSLEQAYRLAALDSMESGEADKYLMVINSKISARR